MDDNKNNFLAVYSVRDTILELHAIFPLTDCDHVAEQQERILNFCVDLMYASDYENLICIPGEDTGFAVRRLLVDGLPTGSEYYSVISDSEYQHGRFGDVPTNYIV